MDWAGIAVVGVTILVALSGIVVVTRIGLNMGRRRYRQKRIRPADGEYEPPDAPEGRYWG
jgi:hypothetical protein